MKRLVILGGGSAGLMAANRLRRAFRRDSLELIVIERREEHLYQPGLTLVVFGLEEKNNIVRPTKELLQPGIKLITDSALKIDPEGKKVTTSEYGDIDYDYLVICTGAAVDPGLTEGLREGLDAAKNVFSFYTLPGAVALREALANFDGGVIVSSICEMPVKSPDAPLTFMMMARDLMQRKGILHKCRFVLTSPMSTIFGREPYSALLGKIFPEMDIAFHPEFAPVAVDHERGKIVAASGDSIPFDLACIVPPHRGEAAVLGSSGLSDERGWVRCEKHHMTTLQYQDIYTLGDAADFPTFKTASGARKQADVLAERLKARVSGQQDNPATYDGETMCPILTRFGKVMIAHFNYTDSISPAWESALYWNVKVHMLRSVYFNLMLPGLM